MLSSLECSDVIIAHCSLKLLVSRDPATSASQVALTIGTCHQAWLILKVLVEMGSCCVAQVGLELLTPSSAPTSASQGFRIIPFIERKEEKRRSAAIIAMRHWKTTLFK